MRSPQVVLENLQKQSLKKDYRFERLYRNLYNPDFYLLAYQNLYANKGAMTPGVDGLTLDGVGMKRIESLIQSLQDHSYQPQPARRRYIPKKSGKGQRPLGIPSANDKLVQEVVRMLLESIYEPTFSKFSHGFRPNRSCHTALAQVQNNFTGVKWFVEGDIKAYFDTIDHHTLVGILRRRIKDESLIALIWKFLKAGYMEDWQYNATYSGTPQGSGISPLLANLYLHELDMYMEEYKKQFDKGDERAVGKDYGRTHRTHQYWKEKYDALWHTMTEEERKAAQREIKALRKQFQQYPAKDPMDENYRRIQYVRYADDFLIGVIGSRADAEKVKADIGRFLSEKLKLAMSQEKTLITHGQDKARFLGYDISICQDTATKRTSRGQSRVYTYRVKLFVPKEKWVGKLLEYGVLKIKTDEHGREKWKPLQRDDFMGLEPREIVSMYNAQIRGMYNYYRLANNVSVLNKFYYVMEYSMYKTFAGKFSTTVGKAKTKYTRDGVFGVEYMTKAGPRKVTFYKGGFSRVTAPLGAGVDCKPEYVVNHQPKELFFRIKAAKCELCGKEHTPVNVHQVERLKDLSGNLPWECVMLKKRRKTLVVCEECHQSIHLTL
ncbi:MAG: group II intron reverse transcriptase/maturase [Clostridia bacterium]|nr:MAG: group II intron reverse transcriptase/maturase [Clostridia bacterium]